MVAVIQSGMVCGWSCHGQDWRHSSALKSIIG